jgi:putative phosphoribosyl transferase
VTFKDRRDAGRQLAERLGRYRDQQPVVLALPRGGVPVGYEIARALEAPLDVIVVRKLGAPEQPELGIGALVDGERPEPVLNQDVLAVLDVSPAYLEREVARQLEEIRRRQRLYRGGRPPVSLAGRTVIVVDDGIATGGSVRAALRGIRRRGDHARLVLAVPVAPPDTVAALRPEVDDLVCLATPPFFGAVGQYYRDFRQTSDAEVIRLLEDAARAHESSPPAS